jgi:tetratricopeptide (TPR) repeat protein
MEKVIKSSVRVPERLYVTREADAQLATVITDMARPGYISVARQMGKTSLLQHVQRQLQGAGRTIVYFDLSAAVYGSAQQYFQHIIDTILEVAEEALPHATQAIMKRRQLALATASASSEYDKELRLILRELPGPLVLILDEVDALAKAAFSDEVFAQIRSVYFMRNTHAVLHNVTYILSGVIEPARLIKNKDNSPFNIATQVFLDDFTLAEYLDFATKARLQPRLGEDVLASIYDWTGGNPRMTYEVCSAVEDQLLAGTPVTVATVEAVVQELYLLNYNRAPVDHIREVMLKSPSLRQAVRTVRRGGPLSDESASQLYLYGIIASRFKSATPTIKNRILSAALSDAWLREVELQHKDLRALGTEQLAAGDWEEGIASLIQYLESEQLTPFNRNQALFALANAYHTLRQYTQSNEYLDRYSVAREENPDDYYLGQSLRALNLASLNQATQGIGLLQEVVDHGARNPTYYSALLNMANIRLAAGFQENYQVALDLLEQAVTQVEKSEQPAGYVQSIICTASFKRASTYLRLGRKVEAYASFERALQQAGPEMKPSALVGLLVAGAGEEQLGHAHELRTVLTNQTLSLQTAPSSDSDFTEKVLHQSLGILYDFYTPDYLNLVQTCADHFYNGDKPVFQLLYEVGAERLTSFTITGEGIFSLALAHPEITAVCAARCYQGLALSIPREKAEYRQQALVALDAIEAVPNYGLLNHHDLMFVVRGVVAFRDAHQFTTALRFINFLTSQLDADDEALLPGDCITIYYLASDVHALLGNVEQGVAYCNRALALVPAWKSSQRGLILLDQAGVENVIRDLKQQVTNRKLQATSVLAKTTRSRKIPRNTVITVRYQDGRQVAGKAKKFAGDLENGLCDIV